MVLPTQRLSVLVSCRSCGATTRLGMTSTAEAVDRRTLAIKLVADPADLVMARLFGDAHVGPFDPSSR